MSRVMQHAPSPLSQPQLKKVSRRGFGNTHRAGRAIPHQIGPSLALTVVHGGFALVTSPLWWRRMKLGLGIGAPQFACAVL